MGNSSRGPGCPFRRQRVSKKGAREAYPRMGIAAAGGGLPSGGWRGCTKGTLYFAGGKTGQKDDSLCRSAGQDRELFWSGGSACPSGPSGGIWQRGLGSPRCWITGAGKRDGRRGRGSDGRVKIGNFDLSG